MDSRQVLVQCCMHCCHASLALALAQAVELGAAAVAEQCREIEAWAARVGKPKRGEDALSTAALEARIEALCAAELEAAYRHSAGVRLRWHHVQPLANSLHAAASSSAEHLPFE